MHIDFKLICPSLKAVYLFMNILIHVLGGLSRFIKDLKTQGALLYFVEGVALRMKRQGSTLDNTKTNS